MREFAGTLRLPTSKSAGPEPLRNQCTGFNGLAEATLLSTGGPRSSSWKAYRVRRPDLSRHEVAEPNGEANDRVATLVGCGGRENEYALPPVTRLPKCPPPERNDALAFPKW